MAIYESTKYIKDNLKLIGDSDSLYSYTKFFPIMQLIFVIAKVSQATAISLMMDDESKNKKDLSHAFASMHPG